jgi:hypothetical protein
MSLHGTNVGLSSIRTDRYEVGSIQVNVVAQLGNGLDILFDVIIIRRCHLYVVVIRDTRVMFDFRTASEDQAHLLLVVITNMVVTIGIHCIELFEDMQQLINIS